MIPTKPPPSFRNPDKWSTEFIDFVSKCLVKNPELRTTAQELMEVYLTTISWQFRKVRFLTYRKKCFISVKENCFLFLNIPENRISHPLKFILSCGIFKLIMKRKFEQ